MKQNEKNEPFSGWLMNRESFLFGKACVEKQRKAPSCEQLGA
ncbi:hypothetical protein HMPREF9069_01508 [Atopobium sp. oral taxon 810 str. F0209]|nr:hypothetical protein HMPREF9069_01508 [Atopobium sp. oral taxon 810 str. F0209]